MRTPRNLAEPTPAEVRLVERFRDLERATTRYRTHARLAGLQLLVLGAWLAASSVRGNAALARLVVLASPLARAAAAGLSLRVYPKVEPDRWARWTPSGFWLGSAALLALLARATWDRPAIPRSAALAGAAMGVGVVLFTVHVLARRAVEGWRGLLAMLPSIDAARDRFENGALWGAVGVALLAVGAYRVTRFLWLGRRMRALRHELRVKPSA